MKFMTLLACVLFSVMHAHGQLLTPEELKAQNYQTVPLHYYEIPGEPERLVMVPETEPMYPGGKEGLDKDFYAGVKYPPEARKNGWQGKLVLRYDIARDGSIQNVRVIENGGPVNQILKDAALEGLKGLKRWHPATTYGDPERVEFEQECHFRLQ